MRSALLAAGGLLLAAILLVAGGVWAAPLSQNCAVSMEASACEGAVAAVMRRGLPALHPLILEVHAEPGSAPEASQAGHRATVEFALLGVPGSTSVELHFDEAAHWGGVSSRDQAEMAAWALAPLLVAAFAALVIVAVAWRRRGGARGLAATSGGGRASPTG